MTEKLIGRDVLSEQRVREVMRGLQPETKYPASELYERYARDARRRGVEPEGPSRLGLWLGRMGANRRRMNRGGKTVAAWLINRWVVEPDSTLPPGPPAGSAS